MAEVATVCKSYGSFDAIVEPNRSIVYPEYLLRWVPYVGSHEVILRIALEQLFFLKTTDTSLDRFHIKHCVTARYIDIERWTGMDSRTLIRHLEHPTALIRKSKPKVGLVKGKAQQLPNTYHLNPLLLTPGDASDIYFFVKDLKESGIALQDALDQISSNGLEKIVLERPYRLPHQGDLFTAGTATTLFAIISTLYGEVSVEEETRIEEIEAELLGIVSNYQAIPWYLFEEVLPVVGPHNLIAYLMCLPRTYLNRHNFRLKDGPSTISSWVGKKTLARGFPRSKQSSNNAPQVLTESGRPTSKEIDKQVLSILFSRVEAVSGVGNYKIHLQSAPILPWHKTAMNVAKSLSKKTKEIILSIKDPGNLNDYDTLLSLLSILKDVIEKLSPIDKLLFQQYVTSKNILRSDGLLPVFTTDQVNPVPFVTLKDENLDTSSNPESEYDPEFGVPFVALDNETNIHPDNSNSPKDRANAAPFVTLNNEIIGHNESKFDETQSDNPVPFVTLKNDALFLNLQLDDSSDKNVPFITLEDQIRVLFVILNKQKGASFVTLGSQKHVLFVTLLKILKSLKILNLIKDPPPPDSEKPDLFSGNGQIDLEEEGVGVIENKKLIEILTSYVDQKVPDEKKTELALWLLEGIWRTSIKSPEGFAWKKIKDKVPPPPRFLALLDLRLADVKNGISGYGVSFGEFSEWSSEQRGRLRSYLPAENGKIGEWLNGKDPINDDQLAENQKQAYSEEPEILDAFISKIESQGIARRSEITNFSSPQLSRGTEYPDLWRLDFGNDYGRAFFEENVGIDVLQAYLGVECQQLDIYVGSVLKND
jgi:hypothetical protein